MVTPESVEPGAVAEKLVAALDRIARGVRRHRQTVATAAGLSPLQLDLLRTLGQGPPPRPTPGELATELAVSQPTVTDSIVALERKGHVERRRDVTDRRRVTVHVTASGRALIAEAEQAEHVLRSTFENLDADDQAQLLSSLLTSISGLLEADIIHVARACTTCRFYDTTGPEARCTLLQASLEPADLRVNCADHEPR